MELSKGVARHHHPPKDVCVCVYRLYLLICEYLYEGHSICNANDLITQSTDSTSSYAMHRLKGSCLRFQMMYNTFSNDISHVSVTLIIIQLYTDQPKKKALFFAFRRVTPLARNNSFRGEK